MQYLDSILILNTFDPFFALSCHLYKLSVFLLMRPSFAVHVTNT